MKSNNKIAFVASVFRHFILFHVPLIKLLQKNGFEIHAYANEDGFKSELEKLNIKCHQIPIERNPFRIKNLIALKRLYNHFKKEQYYIVHCHTPVASILSRTAGKLAKVQNVIYTAHGFHFYNSAPLINWFTYYPIEKIMAYWTDYLITINEEDYSRARNFKVRNSVRYVAGVGVETKFYEFNNYNYIREGKRNELGLDSDEFIILYIAELNDNKNQIQLIESIKSLDLLKYNIKVLFVGVGENDYKLKKLVQMNNLQKHIFFLGYRKDVPELLAASDIIALFSKREGLPKALLEGLSAGKAIIATNVRGNRDLIMNGENGFLVPIADIDITVNRLEYLISNPGLRVKMELKSKELSQKYCTKEVLNQLADIYNEILKSVDRTIIINEAEIV